QQRVNELKSHAQEPSTALKSAQREVEELGARLEETRSSVSKVETDFRDKAAVVAKLKEVATQPSPPAEINAQLTTARAAREAARAALTAATNNVDAAKQKFAAAQSKLEDARKNDSANELAAAESALAHLEEAREISDLFQAREALNT